MKSQVYNSCVHPAVTYGAETWALNSQASNNPAAAHSEMDRSIVNNISGPENTYLVKEKMNIHRRC